MGEPVGENCDEIVLNIFLLFGVCEKRIETGDKRINHEHHLELEGKRYELLIFLSIRCLCQEIPIKRRHFFRSLYEVQVLVYCYIFDVFGLRYHEMLPLMDGYHQGSHGC